MSGYDYIRTMHSFYRPRTPRAALIAAESGILPAEAIIFKGASVKPLFEEPYDPEELERVLAQPTLSFADAMVLAEILATMTRETDKERALFAAESLTALENRWARRVEELRPAYHPGGEDLEAAFRLGRALFEHALVSGRNVPIRNYYLREAYYVLGEMPRNIAGGAGFKLRIRCLLRLGLLDQAEAEISRELSGGAEADGELIALAIEAAYLRKDVHAIHALLGGRAPRELGIDAELADLVASWKA